MSFESHQLDYNNQLTSGRQSPYKQSIRSVLPKDIDPFNLLQLEDILSGVEQWKNIQDIIRISVKALTDTVRLQGETLMSIDRQLGQKVSRQELQTELLGKANSNDVNRNLADIAQTLDQKVSYEECKMITKEEYLIQNKNAQIDINQRIEDSSLGTKKYLAKELQTMQQSIANKPDMVELTDILESKANKQQVTTQLSKKVDKQYVDAKLNQKVDNNEINSILNILEAKADHTQIQKVFNIIESKTDKQELELQNLNIKGLQDDLNVRFQEIQKQYNETLQNLEQQKYDMVNKVDNAYFDKLFNQLSTKIEHNDRFEITKREILDEISQIKQDLINQERRTEKTFIQKDLENENLYGVFREDIIKINEILRSQAEDIRKDLEENVRLVRGTASSVKNEIIRETQILADNLNNFKAEYALNVIDKEEYLNFRNQLNIQLESKVEIEEVQSALNTCQKDISTRLQDYKKENEKLMNNFEENVLQLLKNKVTVQDLHSLLAQKADIKVVESSLMTKVNNKEISQVKGQIEQFNDQLKGKLSINDYQDTFKNCLDDITEIRQIISQKADHLQLGEQINQKIDVQEFQTFMRDIQMELEKKAYSETINRMNRDQCIINESLCTENIIGRWMWKSGQVKSGSQVPWEVQIVNTLPDNFLWEKDKSSVLVCAPGLYEILVGFFSTKKPQVQILVNGEPIISIVNRADSHKIKEHKHSQGQLTGLNFREVIILPQRSRISVVYNGDHNGEGFLALKRL